MSSLRAVKSTIYKMLRISGAFKLVSHLYKRQVLILCYHGGSLGDEWTYNPRLFMRAETFRSRIKILVDGGYSFISLDDLVTKNKADLPDKSICVTFDDGWKSTFTELIPVLAEHSISSTLYLHTQKFVDQMPLYNVAVRYLVSKARNAFIYSNHNLPWQNGDYDLRLPDDVNRLILDLDAWIKTNDLTKGEVYSLLSQLALVLGAQGDGVEFGDGRFDYLSADQACLLPILNCNIELHGHCHRYPMGDPEAFSQDLLECKKAILDVGLEVPKHYCYPSGNHDSLASHVLREHNVISATTCISGFVDEKSLAAPHYLPRFLDGEDVSEIEFRAEISGISDIFRRVRQRL